MSEFDENQPKPEISAEHTSDGNVSTDNGWQTASQQPYQPVTSESEQTSINYPSAPYQANASGNSTGYPQYTQNPSPPQYVPGVYNNTPVAVTAQPNADYDVKHKVLLSRKGKLISGIIIGIAAVIVVSASSIGIYKMFSDGSTPNKSKYSDFKMNEVETPQTDTSIKGDETELTPAQVAAKVRPSIVSIITKDTINYNSQNSGEGSGIIIDSDGYIVTNSHVIGDSNKYQVSVITSDGTAYDAETIGYDTRSDLAVLKINAKDLPACELGDSTKLVLGDYVIAIGNPGGTQFAGSITNGIVSGIDRIIDNADAESTSAMRYIQTNAAINPGNSGGALVNMYGQVIGVNTSKIAASGYEGMGFAIPSAKVKEIVQDLVDYGYVQGRVKLGITCVTISNAYESQGIPAGLQIYSIEKESALSGKAQVYDIITHCEGKRVTSLSQLQDIIFEKKPDDTVELTLYRPATANDTAKSYNIKIKLLEDTGETAEPSATVPSNNHNNYNDFFSDFFGEGNGKNH